MADFAGMDVSGILTSKTDAELAKKVASSKSKLDLDMTDFITLMVTELTHQGIDDSVNTSDMLNQMVQMQMVQAMVNMTDASIMSYSASLVGQTVTVVDGYDSDGKPIELVGKVMGTGQYNGEQVIFLDNDKYYKLSEIMAVGVLPKDAETGDPNDKVEPGDKVDGTDKPEDGDKTEGTEKPGESGGTEGTDQPEGADKTEGSGTEADQADGTGENSTTPEYSGENGVPEDTTT